MFQSQTPRRSADLVIRGAKIALLLFLVSLAIGCGEKSDVADARQYEVRGVVRALPPDEQTIVVEHEDVPGFMPAMTMPFIVREKKARAALRPGDAISFRLNITADDSWIDRIERIAADTVRLPTAPPNAATPRSASPRLREGDLLPAFRLVDQTGKEITPDTFRGHPFVLTFIFTRCPVPNFCPLMSKNFAALQSAIQNGAGILAQTKLLSISFDPEFDTPQVLQNYAQAEAADPAIWWFATGDTNQIESLTRGFSVLVQPEAGTISHSLTTALIDGEGRIEKIWRGNGWKPAEVVSAIQPTP